MCPVYAKHVALTSSASLCFELRLSVAYFYYLFVFCLLSLLQAAASLSIANGFWSARLLSFYHSLRDILTVFFLLFC